MPAPRHAYQFRITLAHVAPPVWRVIQVADTASMWDLHVAIQDAMGWLDCHPHMFTLLDTVAGDGSPFTPIGIPDEHGGLEVLPGWEVDVEEVFVEPGDAASYVYDFGDHWQHDVVLEAILPRVARAKLPRCLDGARACPPEDCGGPPGYGHFLEVIRDPSHREHTGLLDWCGGSFDPEGFRAANVRFDDPACRLRLMLSGP